MASLLDIEIEFWSPLQLDCATEGKMAPVLNVFVFVFLIMILVALPL